jgi:hypothetical protein
MDESRSASLEARINRLERQNWAMKRIIGAACLFGLVGILAAANYQNADLVVARRLVIVDEQGNKRIALDGGLAEPPTTSSINLYDLDNTNNKGAVVAVTGVGMVCRGPGASFSSFHNGGIVCIGPGGRSTFP